MIDFVRITTAYNSYEADFLKEDLEEAGIPCILNGVNLTNLYPDMNGFLGSGIQILVPKDDVTRAQEIVEMRDRLSRVTRCPNCGSSNVDLEPDNAGLFQTVKVIVSAIFAIAPLSSMRQTYHCNSCKSDFKR